MTVNDSTSALLLKGLDGSNPLGFLAAVGTLQVVTEANLSANWRVSWKEQGGHWSPVLLGDVALTADSLIELLMPALIEKKDAFEFADDLTINCEEFRKVAQSAFNAADLRDRHYADFIAAFGCDILPISAKDPRIQDTALRTMSGAGHQHFIGSMRELVESTNSDHLRASLFEPWQYSDSKPSLRWDPLDDRRYALRWEAPSGDPVRTMRGANRLAVEALPLFPTAPRERHLHTTGFSQRRGEGLLFSWPIWEGTLSIEIVRSLISFPELQKPLPDRKSLLALGVVEIYRSQRITRDKYRNFTPAVPV
ncbi:MAG: hypothetical protein OXI53_01400 [Nitrospira sp.]|nr:hypothetical protein [Nitrospira sp.]MDE0403952.1 hypothetical protein [Nitrospira sp.]MDE0487268.1 hypothetical protein [Nitrospira sp.]